MNTQTLTTHEIPCHWPLASDTAGDSRLTPAQPELHHYRTDRQDIALLVISVEPFERIVEFERDRRSGELKVLGHPWPSAALDCGPLLAKAARDLEVTEKAIWEALGIWLNPDACRPVITTPEKTVARPTFFQRALRLHRTCEVIAGVLFLTATFLAVGISVARAEQPATNTGTVTTSR